MRPAPLATYAAQRKVQMAYIASQAKKPGVIYSDRKVGVYQVLALCFGITGAHNFYARRTTQAVIQLGLLLFVWTFVVPFGVFVWNLVEICTVRADGDGKVLI